MRNDIPRKGRGFGGSMKVQSSMFPARAGQARFPPRRTGKFAS